MSGKPQATRGRSSEGGKRGDGYTLNESNFFFQSLKGLSMHQQSGMAYGVIGVLGRV
jgi:hypothetical protein